MIDRRLVENFDWWILLLFSAISCLGLVALYSALYLQIQATPSHNLFVKQIVWFAMGCALLMGALLVDYQKLREWAPWIYAVGVAALALVLIVGGEVKGSRRWLELAGLRVQPSEFMKIAVIIQLARYFSSQDIPPYPKLGHLWPALALAVVPALLILLEPDLGTALCLLIVAGTMTFFIGLRWRYLVTAALIGLVSLYPLWDYVLKDYQKQRILMVLSPEKDPTGSGYHIIQSKVAVGSGMLWGKGFLNGTQNKLKFLPEKHTDFIFSVWAEEWGFLGCVVLIVLFALLIVVCFRVALRSKDRFGSFLVVGLTSLIAWQLIINMGMVLGLLPVVGITLPFVSYGGSSLLMVCLAVGLIENVSMRRYVFRAR